MTFRRFSVTPAVKRSVRIKCANEADAVLWENHFTDMDKTTKNLYGVADNPGTYDGAGIFLFKLAYNFTL